MYVQVERSKENKKKTMLNIKPQSVGNKRGNITRLTPFQNMITNYYYALQLKQHSKKKPLITTNGEKFKKIEKQRNEQSKVESTLSKQIDHWLANYGHAQREHVGMTSVQLDNRGKPIATTFETNEDLKIAVTELLKANEQKLNNWYENTDKDRLVMWGHRDPECKVQGRERLKRPAWHFKQNPMPLHPGYQDISPNKLDYIIGVFDRDSWNGSPKGLVTCYPSITKPS